VGCYRTILVAVDGSPDAAAALRHAESLARDQHAKLVLLTVVPATAALPAPGGFVPPPCDVAAAFDEILRAAADSVAPDIGVQTRLDRGRPAQRIVANAQECGCDLIVMGFHGHGRLHHALIGAVSDSVLRESRLPVLLMRAAAAPVPDRTAPEGSRGPSRTRAPGAR
jgi:nucleotide-binding universal stress UspA family protein